MSQSRMPRKDRERERHRKEIMAAAERVFGVKGYHESSIQDIAAAAEFSVGTLYNFFENKEALFVAILKDGKRDLNSEIAERLSRLACPVEKIRAIITCLMEVAERHKYMLRLLFDYTKPRVLKRDDAIDGELVGSQLKFLCDLTGVFAEAIEQGKIVPLDSRYLAIGLDGMMVRFFELFQILDELNSYNDITPIIEDIFLKEILVDRNDPLRRCAITER